MFQIVPRFDYRIDCHVAEDMGRSRNQHEDAALVAPELALFVIADGMGGHAAGEIAAKLAVEEIRAALADRKAQRAVDAYVATPDLETRRQVFACMRRAIERANTAVRADAEASADRRGMGTTIDLVWLARDHAFVAHAGDSRVFLARQSAVLQLTQDHAQIESLKAGGKVSPHARPTARNRLMNAVGLAETVSVDTLFVDLSRGDRLLLCTDGVHGQIDGEAKLGELLRGGSAAESARRLIAAAGVRGRDNATAIVIDVGDRFVKRATSDRGLQAADLERACASALLVDVPRPMVLGALAASVEVELQEGATVPCAVASDLVAYIVLDGLVRCGATRRVGTGALLFAESLVSVWAEGELPVVEETARLLRVRADDFEEVCAADPVLAAVLYRRLAEHLARSAVRRSSNRPSAMPPAPDSQVVPSSVPRVTDDDAEPSK